MPGGKINSEGKKHKAKGYKRKKQTPPTQDKRERAASYSVSSSSSRDDSTLQSETFSPFGSTNPFASLSLEEGEGTLMNQSLDENFETPKSHSNTRNQGNRDPMEVDKAQNSEGNSSQDLNRTLAAMHVTLKQIVDKLSDTSEKVDRVEADQKVTKSKADLALKTSEEVKKTAENAQNLAIQNARLQRKIEKQANSSCLLILNHGVTLKDINNWALREAEVEKVFYIIGAPMTGPLTLMGTEAIVTGKKRMRNPRANHRNQ